MLSDIFQNQSISVPLISLADRVSNCRPRPIRTFDQIYMLSGDMLAQTELMMDYIKEKNVVFLGDGDGMSMLFGILAAKKYIDKPKRMHVLDFDERIVKNIQNFSNENGFKQQKVKISSELYNIIDPLPIKHRSKFDFFYINPPYGSKNQGKSTIVWLHRCMELCSGSAQGCIIIPYDDAEEWSVNAMASVQSFLLENGFVIRDMVSGMHSYHLKDNPELKSATLIVDRRLDIRSDYEGRQLPSADIEFLYGSPREIPRFIRIKDETFQEGQPDYNWEFGKKSWFDKKK